MKKTVLVTGIGGNVGQGILRNIQSSGFDIRLIGTNTEAVSAGNYFCDACYTVPYAFDESYIPSVKKICETEKVDFIIPSTDYEVYYLAAASEQLPSLIASPAGTAKIFLDKYLTYKHCATNGIDFAVSYLPTEYKGQFESYIVKPREGRGSRGIFINPPSISTFSDENIVQELLTGEEITTAFYITKEQKLLGSITFKRELAAGATNKCEVVTEYDEWAENYMRKLMASLTINGPLNVQSIVTSDGRIVPFEFNCRISGTNSIRSQFGFKDVKYALQEYLFNEQPEKPVITQGSAVRILMDIIYPAKTVADITAGNNNAYIY